MSRYGLGLLSCLVLLCAAAPPLKFVPVDPRFAAGSAEYARIWASDGERIVQAMEKVSGLRFPDAPIDVIVSEGRPMTSFDGRLIRLRAGYSPDYKKATLVHELGHRLALLLPRTSGLDDHRLLYLFLYDVWTDLYGQAFADRMVSIERRIPDPYDYDAAWSWALGQSREQRQERLRALREGAGSDPA
jgi:hypothetical protein